MSEPSKIAQANGAMASRSASERSKSYADIAAQRDSLLRRIGNTNPERATRVLRTSQRYLNNIVNTENYGEMVEDYAKAVERARALGNSPVGNNPAQAMQEYREAKADSEAARWAINAFPYPRSVYMKRRNNR